MVEPVKVKVLGLKRKPGYVYFIDKDGDVSLAKLEVKKRSRSS